MKNFGFLPLILLVLLSSCAPKVNTYINKEYAPLDYREEVQIYGLRDMPPVSSEEIGEVEIGDTGFTSKCDYNTILNLAIEEARKAGGNAIKIIRHNPPSFTSTCHRMSVRILKVEQTEDYYVEEQEDTLSLSGAEYALIHVYRFSGTGFLVGYDLHLGDSVICRVKNNWKETIKVTKEGKNTLWAKTEAKEEIPIDIEFGNEYYIRCGIGTGIFVGRPKLVLVTGRSGKYEFESITE